MNLKALLAATLVASAAILAPIASAADSCTAIKCTKDYKPVCGSDNVTYSNKCMLSIAQCRNSTITLLKDAACAASVSCNAGCTKDYRPVCGSDKVTYSNPCMFKYATCSDPAKKNVTIVHDGECTSAQADTDKCNAGCTKDYRPVCGSDKVTYSNPCMFKYATCSDPAKKNVTIVHDGECGATTCNTACQEIYRPVCGTDFVTYTNECELGVARCVRRDASLQVMTQGACKPCATMCTTEYRPVCASNGQTYSNTCVFESARCLKKDASMVIVHAGACKRLRH